MLRDRLRRASCSLRFPVAFLLFIANTVPGEPLSQSDAAVRWRVLAGGGAVARLLAARGVGRARSLAASSARRRPADARGGVSQRRDDAFFRQTDTRTQALRLDRSAIVPPDASILVQPYSVPLRSRAPASSKRSRAHRRIAGARVDQVPASSSRSTRTRRRRTGRSTSGAAASTWTRSTSRPAAFRPTAALAPLRARAGDIRGHEAVQCSRIRRWLPLDARPASKDAPVGRDVFAVSRRRASPRRRAARARRFSTTPTRAIDPALERPGPIDRDLADRLMAIRSAAARGRRPPRARGAVRSRACWRAIAAAGTSSAIEGFLTKQGRPRRPPARRRGLRSDDAVQSELRVLLRRRRCSTSRASGAQELPLEVLQRAFPGPGRPAGQPDRRRDLHAQGHPRRDGGRSARRATSAATSRRTARSSPTSAPRRWPSWRARDS